MVISLPSHNEKSARSYFTKSFYRREDEQEEEQEVADVDEFVFNDDGSNEVADSSALQELNKIVDQLKGIEDTEDYTLDDLQVLQQWVQGQQSG